MNNSSFMVAISIYFLLQYVGQSLKVKKSSQSVSWKQDGQHTLSFNSAQYYNNK